jgi:hypothetical protein
VPVLAPVLPVLRTNGYRFQHAFYDWIAKHRFAVTLAAALLSSFSAANASACPGLDALTQRYGISFSGFDKPIPAVQGPAVPGEGRLARLPVASPEIVSDGFRHTVLFDPATKKAWILRTGGFAGVHEWYGPVDAGSMALEDCRSEPVLPRMRQAEKILAGAGPA